MHKNKKCILSPLSKGNYRGILWFTLLELIVVITILAILWTIAFIAMQGYSKTARDSKRISDVSRIKTSLELFKIESATYPEVTDGYEVTYSWATAWTQGTFWEQTYRNVEKLDKVPLDPTTNIPYTYSITSNKKEYQVASIIETDLALGNISQAEAARQRAMARITWTYNWKTLKVKKGILTIILATPSIISSEYTPLETQLNNNTLAYDGFSNLPANYEWSTFETIGEGSTLNLVNKNNVELFSWKLTDLTDVENWATARKALVTNIKIAYSNTKIASNDSIARLLSVDTTNKEDTENTANYIINNDSSSSLLSSTKSTTTESPSNSKVISKGEVNCPPNSRQGTKCHQLSITCEGISARDVMIRQYSKENAKASIVLGVGGYGNTFYTNFGSEASKTIKELYQNNYEVFEYAWKGQKGWGENASGFGYKKAMCGYSEMLKWINSNLADKKNNICVNGNSGGSLQIAYGIKYYGLQDNIKMAILSGGPPSSDLKAGIYDENSLAYWENNAGGLSVTDYLMGEKWLTNKYAQNRDLSKVPSSEIIKLEKESLVGNDTKIYSFKTKINFVESNDETNADDQGKIFYDSLKENKNWYQLPFHVTEHRVPSTKEGAEKIRELFLNECQ